MKTVKQYLEELPEPYNEMALENVKKQGYERDLKTKYPYPIACAFIWDKTPEGHRFWEAINDNWQYIKQKKW